MIEMIEKPKRVIELKLRRPPGTSRDSWAETVKRMNEPSPFYEFIRSIDLSFSEEEMIEEK